MPAAETAVREAAVGIPVEILDRLHNGEKLSNADREAITKLTRQAIDRVTESGEHPIDDEQQDSGATS
jgi:hypothetical protein